MDNINQQPENNMPTQPEKSSTGALIGSIIVIIILILGAIYFWGGKLNKSENTMPTENTETSVVSDIEDELGQIPEIDVDLESL